MANLNPPKYFKPVYLFILFLAFISFSVFTQVFKEVPVSLPGYVNVEIDIGDYDNDYDLDILVTGISNGYADSRILKNTGNNSFDPIEINPDMYAGSVNWGDYNNDGNLDFILSGQNRINNETYYYAQLYENIGSDYFEKQENIFFTGTSSGSIEWGDCDNDSDLDIILCGYSYSGDNNIVTEIYSNTEDNQFSKINIPDLEQVYDGDAEWGDLNNDGKLDFIISGSSDEMVPVTKIYKNNGANSFTEVSNPGLPALVSVSSNLGDFDNDGDLDILIAGRDSKDKIHTVILENMGNFVFNAFTAVNLTGIYWGSVSWIDYNCDGYLDIFLCGRTINSDVNVSELYENNGNKFFNKIANPGIEPFYDSDLSWGDYDKDGDPDLFIAGMCADVGSLKIYENTSINLQYDPADNLPPSAPENLISDQENTDVILSWSESNDIETPSRAITYNICIGASDSSYDVLSPMSFINQFNDKRMITSFGMINDNSWTIKDLSPGKYYWRVQASDYSYNISLFSETDSFTVIQKVIVPGGNVSGTWTKTASLYQITGDITIPTGDTLLIERGVKVEFQGYYKLQVNGVLLALGSQEDSILFTINDTTGFYNSSDSLGGWAGIRFNTNTSDTCIFNYCIFEYGKATILNNENGGVIYLKGSQRKFLINNCVFRNNKASGHGGSIYSESDGIVEGRLTIDNCLFIGNTAKWGGGAEICSYNDINSIMNCQFIRNKAELGGGLKLETAVRTFYNNLFYENEATENGGGIFLGGPTTQRIENCIIVRNFAPHGAGLSCYMVGYNDIINTSIINNNSDHSIIYLGEQTFTEIYNCIIWNPYNNEFEQNFTNGSLTIKYSDIRNGKDSAWFGEGCIDNDPLFSYSWKMDFKLDKNSPCIDKGSNEYVTCSVDFYGNLRKIKVTVLDSAIVDMGAIEVLPNYPPEILLIPDQKMLPSNITTIPVYFTDKDTTDAHIIIVKSDSPHVQVENISGNTSGSTFDLIAEGDWTGSSVITVFVCDNSGQFNAMDSVQFNLIVSDEVCGHINKNTRWNIDTVKVTCNIVVDSDATLYIDPGTIVEFQGSYKLVINGILKACGLPGDSIYFTIAKDKTNVGWKGIEFRDKNLTNDTAKIEYCVINKVINSGPISSNPKGAISIIYYNRLLISASTITDNIADNGCGGGIYCLNSNPVIINNLISDNYAMACGGGLYFQNSSPLIQNNYIIDNTVGALGGGIYLIESTALISNNKIFNNEAYQGGGISTEQSNNIRITGNIISDNRASNSAGGIQFYNSRGFIINNTIFGNSGSDYAGGIEINRSHAVITNTIIRDNQAGLYCNEICVARCDTIPDIINCNIKNGLNGIFTGDNTDSIPGLFLNNIDSDPMFADPDNRDFRLEPESPCRNNGYFDTTGLNLPDLDIYGNPRIFEDIIDIGAAECMGQPVKYRPVFLEKTDIKCFGENNGSIDLHVFFGQEPYNYNWSTGDTVEDLSGLLPGLYYVTITDVNDSTITDSVQVLEPNLLISEIKDITPPTYYGFSDAKAKVTVLGGSPPYYYLWDDPDSTRKPEVNSLKGNSVYRVQISDRKGCTAADSVLIFESDKLYTELLLIKNLICNGDTNGVVKAFAYYAEEPITYLWDDPASSTDSIIKNLSANKVYHVLITDAIGNTGYDSIKLIDPDPIHIDSIFIEDVEPCFGDTNGSIAVIANMGSASLQYSIDNGTTFLKDWYFNNLAAGEYMMVIKDTNNCLFELDNLIVHQPEKIQSDLITGNDQVNNDETTFYNTTSRPGSAVEWFISGGSLLNGQGTDLVNVQWASEGAGKISFVETDSNGCTGDTVSLVVEIFTGYLTLRDGQIKIFPNPFNDKVIIQLPNSQNSYYDLVITDLTGKVIRSIAKITGNCYELNRDNLPTGIYIIELSGPVIYRGKIIIE